MKFKALIVDDISFLSIILSRMLQDIAVTDTASNGEEAIKKFSSAFYQDKPYDLICLDIKMPNIDGVQVLEFIRNFEKESENLKNGPTKIIMTTGVNQKDEVIKVMKKGSDGYIVKPYHKDKIYQEVKRLNLI